MNTSTQQQVTEKQGWLYRLVAAVWDRSLAWILQYPTGIVTPETMMFMSYYGSGLEEAMTYQYICRLKLDREER